MTRLFAALLALSALLGHARLARAELKVGSKRFVESYVLAEIAVQTARAGGGAARHERGLGGTAVTFRALEEGAIDVYPEYTGTLSEAIVASAGAATDLTALRAALAKRGLALSEPLGFENKYALAVRRDTARALHVGKLSDLAAHAELRFALSHELMGRRDGWPGLAERYGLRPASVSAIDHALAYEALTRSDADVIDVYTTDAKVARFGLVVLADDAAWFPRYDAVLVYRADLLAREPAFARVLALMRGALDESTMQRLNARAEIDGLGFDEVAREYLRDAATSGVTARDAAARAAPVTRPDLVTGTARAIVAHGPRHVALVFGSVALSTLIGVPLGVLAFTRRRAGAAVLAISGALQTIPSLALFCFMIPLLGIGWVPALAALFLYGLLPIVRNTHAGLSSIPAELREAALALGLSPAERLRHVELPLASRTILAGVKTSAVVAVGSATIAAFIGAGGFGEPISTGLSLNDVPTVLHGAIPAAALALLVEGAFSLVERAVVPLGLRLRRGGREPRPTRPS